MAASAPPVATNAQTRRPPRAEEDRGALKAKLDWLQRDGKFRLTFPWHALQTFCIDAHAIHNSILCDGCFIGFCLNDARAGGFSSCGFLLRYGVRWGEQALLCLRGAHLSDATECRWTGMPHTCPVSGISAPAPHHLPQHTVSGGSVVGGADADNLPLLASLVRLPSSHGLLRAW
jgi:hypothetical protein